MNSLLILNYELKKCNSLAADLAGYNNYQLRKDFVWSVEISALAVLQQV